MKTKIKLLVSRNMHFSRIIQQGSIKRTIIALLAIFLTSTSLISAANVDVTFRVDLNGINTADGVYVGSDWAGWSLNLFQKLTDSNNDGVFETTLSLPAGGSYNYRYTIGNYDWNHFEDLSATTCGYGPAKQDRHILVPQSNQVLDVCCFNSCTDCNSTIKSYLNLSVDMRFETISPNGVHVAGSFNSWNSGSIQLTDNNNDKIYDVSIPVVSGKDYEYKFLNGNSWGTDELVFGPCEFASNRRATINGTTTMPLVRFGYCNATGPTNDIKIACVGNSITWGNNGSATCWPFQLRDMLGNGYYAENLGVSGRTMLKTGDYPWWNEPQYSLIFKFQPDIIVIKLGTNDSKPFNWNASNYKADCIDMINKFRAMNSHPTIYMITPAKAYSAIWEISDATISSEIIPILKEISFEKAVHVIDVYSATTGMSANFPDGVHPNDKGATAIAQKVKANLLEGKPVIKQVNPIAIPETDLSYQWFLNDAPIAGGNAKTINATIEGKYKVAVKVSAQTNDIYVSDPFNLTFAPGNIGKTVGLTTDGNVPTTLNSFDGISEVIISPNPATDRINIANAADTNVSIINILGETLIKKEIHSQNEQIDIPNMKSGCYLVILKKDNSVVTKQLIVE